MAQSEIYLPLRRPIKLVEIRQRLLPWLRDNRPERATPRRAVGYPLSEAWASLKVEG